MQRTLIIDALNTEKAQSNITLCGWVRTRRDAKGFSFVEINDGSCLANMQCIVDEGTEAYAALGEANTGAALAVSGELTPSPGKGQKWEVRAKSVTVFGLADPASFPLQKKNFCAASPICARVPTNTGRPSAFAPRPGARCMTFSTGGVSPGCTRPCSPVRTAKARARCSA